MIELPDPEYGNGEAIKASIQTWRSADGVRRTYIKDPDENVFSWSFRISRKKREELTRFVDAYKGEYWRVYDHTGAVIAGRMPEDLLTFPVDMGETSIANLTLRGSRIT